MTDERDALTERRARAWRGQRMKAKTIHQRSGLHRLADRIRRGMVWRWHPRGGASYEVTKDSARRRREEWEEKKRVREAYQGSVNLRGLGSFHSGNSNTRWIPGA